MSATSLNFSFQYSQQPGIRWNLSTQSKRVHARSFTRYGSYVQFTVSTSDAQETKDAGVKFTIIDVIGFIEWRNQLTLENGFSSVDRAWYRQINVGPGQTDYEIVMYLDMPQIVFSPTDSPITVRTQESIGKVKLDYFNNVAPGSMRNVFTKGQDLVDTAIILRGGNYMYIRLPTDVVSEITGGTPTDFEGVGFVQWRIDNVVGRAEVNRCWYILDNAHWDFLIHLNEIVETFSPA